MEEGELRWIQGRVTRVGVKSTVVESSRVQSRIIPSRPPQGLLEGGQKPLPRVLPPPPPSTCFLFLSISQISIHYVVLFTFSFVLLKHYFQPRYISPLPVLVQKGKGREKKKKERKRETPFPSPLTCRHLWRSTSSTENQRAFSNCDPVGFVSDLQSASRRLDRRRTTALFTLEL